MGEILADRNRLRASVLQGGSGDDDDDEDEDVDAVSSSWSGGMANVSHTGIIQGKMNRHVSRPSESSIRKHTCQSIKASKAIDVAESITSNSFRIRDQHQVRDRQRQRTNCMIA